MEQENSAPSSRRTKTSLLTVGLLLLAGLVMVFAWGLQIRESTQLNGSSAPPFAFTSFEGEQISSAELPGRPVVLNFWASWCVECYKEAGLLEQAYQDYKDKGVVFLGIDYLDTDKEALAYMQKYGVTYPSGPDLGSKISRDYRITGVPETFFIDKTGRIAHVQIGPIEQPQLYGLLDQLVSR